MLFALLGFFKPGVDTAPDRLQGDVNEYLGQPFVHLRLGGLLRDEAGRRVGTMILMQAESFARATAFAKSDPYFASQLYERVEVVEYVLEVGRLD